MEKELKEQTEENQKRRESFENLVKEMNTTSAAHQKMWEGYSAEIANKDTRITLLEQENQEKDKEMALIRRKPGTAKNVSFEELRNNNEVMNAQLQKLVESNQKMYEEFRATQKQNIASQLELKKLEVIANEWCNYGKQMKEENAKVKLEAERLAADLGAKEVSIPFALHLVLIYMDSEPTLYRATKDEGRNRD